jgi:hypothetical protein
MKPNMGMSLINCHAVGMDSIVFKESSPMIRAFVCRPEHTLWRNDVPILPSWREPLLSVALHQHRQDITMVPVRGQIFNVFMAQSGKGGELYGYDYDSKILSGKGGFRRIHGAFSPALEIERLEVPLFLRGTTFHTVYVPRGETAAWLICEGDPNDRYSSACYTNDPKLDEADFSDLYKPMTGSRLLEDLEIIG